MEAKSKPFDCLEMKNRIHAQLAEQDAGLTDDQRRERIERDLMTSDDEIARWWRQPCKDRMSAGNNSRS